MLDRRTFFIALAGTTLSGAGALAQSLPLPGGLLGADGDEFRQMALMGGDFAIRTSEIALQRSRNPRVRQFAELEIEEQTGIAAALGATPGQSPLRADQAQVIEGLQQASVGTFDRMYVRGQIAGHDELLTLNSDYSQNGGDPSERSVAIVAVPSIRTHLAILQALRSGRLA